MPRPPRDCWRWPTGSTARRRTRRDGGHRRVLEAGVARARRPLRAGAGQRRARQERARPQDRRQRRDVAGRPAGPRPDPRQLRAAGGGAGAARADAHAQAVRAREKPRTCSASRRCSKTPTSSSASCSATSWARAAAPSCRPSSTATTIPSRCSPHRSRASRPAAPKCSKRCVDTSARHHRFMLKLHLQHIDALDRAIADDRKGGGPRARTVSQRRPTREHDALA